jgi:hypothetical protein
MFKNILPSVICCYQSILVTLASEDFSSLCLNNKKLFFRDFLVISIVAPFLNEIGKTFKTF